MLKIKIILIFVTTWRLSQRNIILGRKNFLLTKRDGWNWHWHKNKVLGLKNTVTVLQSVEQSWRLIDVVYREIRGYILYYIRSEGPKLQIWPCIYSSYWIDGRFLCGCCRISIYKSEWKASLFSPMHHRTLASFIIYTDYKLKNSIYFFIKCLNS